MDTARREADGWKVYVLAGYYLISGNVSISIAVLGGLQVLLGLGLNATVAQGTEGNWAIFAGFFGIWGASLILLGLGSFGMFWANKVYDQAVAENTL